MCFPGNVEIMLSSFQKPKAGLQVVSPKKLSQCSTISRQVRCSHLSELACSSPAPGQRSTEDKAVKQGVRLSSPPLVPPGIPPHQGSCFPSPLIHSCYQHRKHPALLHSTCKVRLKTSFCNKKELQAQVEEQNHFYSKPQQIG